MEHGGIYLDMDTLCLRPFTPLLHHECVMGHQNPGGLCDATILAAPRSLFMRRWWNEYRWFRSKGHDEFWDEHATGVPYQLAQLPGLFCPYLLFAALQRVPPWISPIF